MGKITEHYGELVFDFRDEKRLTSKHLINIWTPLQMAQVYEAVYGARAVKDWSIENG